KDITQIIIFLPPFHFHSTSVTLYSLSLGLKKLFQFISVILTPWSCYLDDWYKAFTQPSQFIFYFQRKLIKDDFINQSMFNQLAKLRIKYTTGCIGDFPLQLTRTLDT